MSCHVSLFLISQIRQCSEALSLDLILLHFLIIYKFRLSRFVHISLQLFKGTRVSRDLSLIVARKSVNHFNIA